MEKSFWISEKPSFPVLDADTECEVCVIGAGIAGLTAAYELSAAGRDVIVLEAKSVAKGNTAGASAVVSYAHDLIYDRLIKHHGTETARQYYLQNTRAQERLREIIAAEGIDCAYKQYGSVIYATEKKAAKQIEKERRAYEKLGVDCGYVTDTGLPFSVRSALLLDGQAVINPYDYAYELAKAAERRGVRIYENAHVAEQPKDGVAKAGGLAEPLESRFTVRAKKFIIATHFPFINALGFYFLKMYQHRGFNIVFSHPQPLKYVYESADKRGCEYRQAADGLILASGANVRTGRYHYESCYDKVLEFIARDFFDGDITAAVQAEVSRFSAQDCMTLDLLPFAGRYSAFTDGVYVISGFNKWGFTNSLISASHIAGTCESENIFNPLRAKPPVSFLKGAANAGALIKEFSGYVLDGDLKKIKRVKPGQGAVVRYKGKRIGVYRTDSGKLKAVSGTCRHVGCPLRWNKDEKTFDCACHGSRYDTDGRIIDNPSVKNLPVIDIKNP